MNTRAVSQLAGVISRAQENGRRTPMGLAIAVESAGWAPPEAAAAMASIAAEARVLAAEAQSFRERIAEQESEIVRLGKQIAEAGDAGAEAFQRAGENGALAIDLRLENERLTALVESMCAALTGHDCPDPNDGPMETVTRAAVRLMEAEARVAELEAAAAQRLAADFEAMRVALLANSHPELAHAALDADDDTAYPLPGVAHPKAEGRAS